MKTLILKPQFIDRAGRTVYTIYEDDPECRVLKAGHMIGQVRFHEAKGFEEFEAITIKDFEVKGSGTG